MKLDSTYAAEAAPQDIYHPYPQPLAQPELHGNGTSCGIPSDGQPGGSVSTMPDQHYAYGISPAAYPHVEPANMQGQEEASPGGRMRPHRVDSFMDPDPFMPSIPSRTDWQHSVQPLQTGAETFPGYGSLSSAPAPDPTYTQDHLIMTGTGSNNAYFGDQNHGGGIQLSSMQTAALSPEPSVHDAIDGRADTATPTDDPLQPDMPLTCTIRVPIGERGLQTSGDLQALLSQPDMIWVPPPPTLNTDANWQGPILPGCIYINFPSRQWCMLPVPDVSQELLQLQQLQREGETAIETRRGGETIENESGSVVGKAKTRHHHRRATTLGSLVAASPPFSHLSHQEGSTSPETPQASPKRRRFTGPLEEPFHPLADNSWRHDALSASGLLTGYQQTDVRPPVMKPYQTRRNTDASTLNPVPYGRGSWNASEQSRTSAGMGPTKIMGSSPVPIAVGQPPLVMSRGTERTNQMASNAAGVLGGFGHVDADAPVFADLALHTLSSETSLKVYNHLLALHKKLQTVTTGKGSSVVENPGRCWCKDKNRKQAKVCTDEICILSESCARQMVAALLDADEKWSQQVDTQMLWLNLDGSNSSTYIQGHLKVGPISLSDVFKHINAMPAVTGQPQKHFPPMFSYRIATRVDVLLQEERNGITRLNALDGSQRSVATATIPEDSGTTQGWPSFTQIALTSQSARSSHAPSFHDDDGSSLEKCHMPDPTARRPASSKIVDQKKCFLTSETSGKVYAHLVTLFDKVKMLKNSNNGAVQVSKLSKCWCKTAERNAALYCMPANACPQSESCADLIAIDLLTARENWIPKSSQEEERSQEYEFSLSKLFSWMRENKVQGGQGIFLSLGPRITHRVAELLLEKRNAPTESASIDGSQEVSDFSNSSLGRSSLPLSAAGISQTSADVHHPHAQVIGEDGNVHNAAPSCTFTQLTTLGEGFGVNSVHHLSVTAYQLSTHMM
ncbi:hypothetical protein QFC22_005548 [Naganishia vaughanmartiniae]|uniref:Uncharacterized protein n=1 Tax=Naganishia vaughanmartiniae TaxID=1424756 RepID=A0ACC2WUF6_9TREE|nr:hypothetical protein QFC22_005548 [Naganishia vaughanmartiniae]